MRYNDCPLDSNLSHFPVLDAQIQRLHLLVEKYPILIPVPECCKLLKLSDEGLRRAILKKQISGAFWWRKEGKQNYAYRIQTLPFYVSYVSNLIPFSASAPELNLQNAAEYPPVIQKRIRELYQLIQRFPVSIPIRSCSRFLGVSGEGLRCAVRLGNFPGGLCWKQPGKDQFSYSIQAVPFFAWQMKDCRFVRIPAQPETNCA